MGNKIIIDNIDVSKCQYLALNRQKLTYDHLLIKIPHYCDAENLQCENKNCYYKQLQKALQDIEAYKLESNEAAEIIAELEYKNEELKKENKKLFSQTVDLKFELDKG